MTLITGMNSEYQSLLSLQLAQGLQRWSLPLLRLGEAVGFNGMNSPPGAEHSGILTLLMAIPLGHAIAFNEVFI